jgi:predicted transcriptional regulator
VVHLVSEFAASNKRIKPDARQRGSKESVKPGAQVMRHTSGGTGPGRYGLGNGAATGCGAPPGGYTNGMKTAISIPDDVFADAERLARTLKKSRSELYSRAVREYVARHSVDQVTATLDSICQEGEPQVDAFAKAAARRTLEHSEW